MATTMRFLILGDDRASSAFNKFARSVDSANRSVDRHNAALARQGKAADSARGALASLIGEVSGFGAAQTVASRQTSMFAKALGAVNLATGVLEPALAGLLVAAGGLSAAFASAGAGVAAYGAALGPVMTQTSDAMKAQETLSKARATADANYQAAIKSGASVKTAEAARTRAMTTAQLAYNEAVKGTPPVVLSFARSVTAAKDAYKSWADSLAGATLTPLQIALSQVKPVLTAIRPLVLAAANAFTTLMTEMSRKIESGGLERVAGVLLPHVRQAILDLGHSVGNIAAGIWGILKAFMPVSDQITGGVVKLTARFKEWANSLPQHSGFQSLMNMFRTTTPGAVAVLKNLTAVLLNISRAMVGIATPANSKLLVQVLMPLTSIMKTLSANQGLVQTVLYFLLFRKALSPVAGLLGPMFKGTGLLAGAFRDLRNGVGLVTVAMNLLKVAFLSNPIGIVLVAVAGLAAAFVVLWQRSRTFRNIMKEAGVYILAFAKIAVSGFRIVVDAWLGMVSVIIHGAAKAFGWIPGLGPKIKGAAKAFDNFKTGVDNAFNGAISTITRWQNKLRDSEETSANARKHIIADFNQQAQASDRATRGVTSLSNAVTAGGKHSDQAQAARHRLIDDMTKAGIKASTARTDVDRYTTAVDKNGKNSDQARAARTRLIKDILSASNNSARGRTDMDRLTAAVRQHGQNSDQARGARQRLIKDLVNSGLDAKQARNLVDTLRTSITKLHGKRVNVEAHGSGSGGIVFKQTFTGQKKVDRLIFAAGGMKVPGYGGGDRYPALLEGGEAVVPKHLVPQVAPFLRQNKVPGFASGGFAGPERAISKTPSFMADAETGFMKTAMRSGIAAEIAKIKAALKAMQAKRGGGGGYGGYGVAPNGPLQQYARKLLAARGWANQWAAFNALVMGESGWRVDATNPSSGAYGIPQALPGSKMASAGADWRTSGYTQLRWMMGYIASVYGSPARAYGMWSARSPHWYDQGGLITEPIMGVGLRTGRGYGFREGEGVVTDARRSGTRGPLISIEHYHASDAADASLLAQRVSFALLATGGLGS